MSTVVPVDPGLVLRPLRRTEYDVLVRSGLLEDEPVELLEGALVEVSPQLEPHARLVALLTRHFTRALSDEWLLRQDLPFLADDLSEPEPDIAVVPWPRDEQAPSAAVLLIEVSHTSLAKDLGVKARVYARADVAEYWVLDLAGSVVHVHTGARGDRWTSVVQQGFDVPLTAAGVHVVIADLLR